MSSIRSRSFCALVALLLILGAKPLSAQRQMERLGRGVVAINQGGGKIFVSWRVLGTDPDSISFNLYRTLGAGGAVKLNGSPVTGATNFVDTGVDLSQGASYYVRPIVNGIERASSGAFRFAPHAPTLPYLSIPLSPPPVNELPDGGTYTYTANDCSAGDLDGDGEYEIVLKWDPTDSKDNSQSGYTGDVWLDGYKLDGTRLWRIDLGPNIRAGAHYTEFVVYDLDGDGKAEVACKTADGSKDGLGHVIGNPNVDYRNSAGYILQGPEYLTVFDGMTGAALDTQRYNPQRCPTTDFPTLQQLLDIWGDNYGNRVDRFNAGVGYLDGVHPSLIMSRGYYTGGPNNTGRTAIAAWDFRGGRLTQRWKFDTYQTAYSGLQYLHQGNHSICMADVDGDGKDEVIYGAMVIDDDGKPIYTTGLGHGDAQHTSDLDPSRPGLEIFSIHEVPPHENGIEMRDALTGELLWHNRPFIDVGRGMSADIDPTHPGYESWASGGGINALYDCKGTTIALANPSTCNMGIWWDADLLGEILNGTTIDKWNWVNNTTSRLLTATGCSSNNSTKANPCLSADLFGDWREELVERTSASDALRIYTTTIPTTYRFSTFMHDPLYRNDIVTQQSAYNQPPHTSFYMGAGMATPPKPNIVLVPASPGGVNRASDWSNYR